MCGSCDEGVRTTPASPAGPLSAPHQAPPARGLHGADQVTPRPAGHQAVCCVWYLAWPVWAAFGSRPTLTFD